MTDSTDVMSVYAELLSRAPENKMEPRMGPMWRSMELLGDPQLAYPTIHITGTNGKTSTARMIEAGLRAHDLRTGRYTSPHLVSVTERISVDGEPVDDATFVRIWDEIRPVVSIVDEELKANGEVPLTYFEALTVLAFAVFADAPVDVAVIEVGLGGITDATNVVSPAVSVVTPISLDHTDLLGDTVREIAEEKAGIIKPGSFLVSSAQEPDAADVLLAAAQDAGIPFRFQGVEFGVDSRDVAVGGQLLALRGTAGTYPDLHLPLHGEHQAQNASVAVVALEAFFGAGEHTTEEGEPSRLNQELLTEAFTQVRSPGRMEVILNAPTVIVDAAHNPAGIAVSTAALAEAFSFSRLIPVVGMLAEKDASEYFRVLREGLGRSADHIVLTASDSPRAIPVGTLKEYAQAAGWAEEEIHLSENVMDGMTRAMALADQVEDYSAGIFITGSITVVGEATALIDQVKSRVDGRGESDPEEDAHGA